MKSRGFTLLELLMTIAILGVVISLLWRAYLETERMRETALAKTDGITAVIGAAETLTALFRSLQPGDDSVLGSDSAEFSGFLRGAYGRVSIRPDVAGPHRTALNYRSEERPDFDTQLQVSVRFRYWNGESWMDSWSGSGLPEAVVIEMRPDVRRQSADEPYRICVNIPAGATVAAPVEPAVPEETEGDTDEQAA